LLYSGSRIQPGTAAGLSAHLGRFRPFVEPQTADGAPTGEDTGLGLLISYDIVTQQHGGTITVRGVRRVHNPPARH